MPAVKNLVVRAGGDFSALKRSMDKAKKDMDNFKSSISSSLKKLAAAFIGFQAIDFLKDAGNDAIKFEALMGTLSQTLGSSMNDFIKWQNTVGGAMGFSKLTAAEMANNFSLRLKDIATDQQDLFNKTTSLMKAAAIIRSKTGMSQVEISDRMRSAMNGEADGADELGVNVRVSAIQQSKAYKMLANNAPWSDLSSQMQKTILYYHIMDSVNSNFGDKITQNTALLKGNFTAALGDVRLAIGKAFLPFLNIALPILTKLARAAEWAFLRVAQLMRALFPKANIAAGNGGVGAQTTAVDGLGDSYSNAADQADKAGKAAKEAAKSVAGFDEVNTLASSAADAGAGAGAGDAAATGGGVSLGDVGDMSALDPIPPKIKAIADKIREVFTNFTTFLKDKKEIIVSIMAGIAAGLAVGAIVSNWSAITAGIAAGFNALRAGAAGLGIMLAGVSWWIVAIVVAVAAIVAAIVYFYQTNETFRGVVDGIFRAIGEAAKWLWNDVLVPLGKWLGTVFVAAWDGLGEAARWLWKNVLVPFGSFCKTLYDEALVPIGKVLIDVLKVAFEKVSEVAKSFWQNVLVPLGAALKEMLGPAVEALSAVFGVLWNDVLKPFGNFLGDVFIAYWSELADEIEWLWKNVLKPVAEFVGDGLVKAFDGAFKTMGTLITDLKDAFIGLMNFITDVFHGDWEKALKDLASVAESIFSALGNTIKIPFNFMIDLINQAITAVNGLDISIPDWVPKIGGKTIGGFNIPLIPKLAKGGITNGEMVATIGDNPGGREVVSPLGDLMGMITTAVSNAMAIAQMSSGNNTSKLPDIVFQVDGVTFARVTNPYAARESQRIGGSMIIANG
jgi:hypothetical protein